LYKKDKTVEYQIAETKSKRFVWQRAMLVGVADSRGTIYNPRGLDVDALTELKKAGKSVAESPMRVE